MNLNLDIATVSAKTVDFSRHFSRYRNSCTQGKMLRDAKAVHLCD